MSLSDAIAALEVEVDGIRRQSLERQATTMTRRSTQVTVTGGGLTGVGEDISHGPSDHDGHEAMPLPPLSGRRTLGEWSEILDSFTFAVGEMSQAVVPNFRRWSYESALLDLALHQAGVSLAGALGRSTNPLRFCVSPPEDPRPILEAYPGTELKINTDPDWTDQDMRDINGLDAVRVVDLKAHYVGDFVRHPADPVDFTRRVAEAFPEVILEDPHIGEGMDAFYAAESHRVAFDAPIHSLAELDALPVTGWVNIKPSRFGSLRGLFECLDACEARGLGLYGGGQFEIGPGRAQVQTLAAVLYPTGPNDTAPSGYNDADLPGDLSRSPLELVDAPGFGAQPRETTA